MGSDKTQVGARVDSATYDRFKDFVEDTHGRLRGVLSHEVERALEAYMAGQYPTDQLSRIETDVATVKSAVARADGGVAVDGGAAHTRTHAPTGTEVDVDRDDTDRPGRRAPKAEKVDWLFDDLTTGDGIVINPAAIERKIATAWGFGERATGDLIALLYDRYHALPVRTGDRDPWHVALGASAPDRQVAIDVWADGNDYQYIDPYNLPDVADFLH